MPGPNFSRTVRDEERIFVDRLAAIYLAMNNAESALQQAETDARTLSFARGGEGLSYSPAPRIAGLRAAKGEMGQRTNAILGFDLNSINVLKGQAVEAMKAKGGISSALENIFFEVYASARIAQSCTRIHADRLAQEGRPFGNGLRRRRFGD
jgi:hypothetical protein